MKGAEETCTGSADTAVFGPRSRREFLLGATAAGGVLHGAAAAAQDEKKTFTILHTPTDPMASSGQPATRYDKGDAFDQANRKLLPGDGCSKLLQKGSRREIERADTHDVAAEPAQSTPVDVEQRHHGHERDNPW